MQNTTVYVECLLRARSGSLARNEIRVRISCTFFMERQNVNRVGNKVNVAWYLQHMNINLLGFMPALLPVAFSPRASSALL